tara:strand:+ start:277 stop:606 length:330 start_codon:yes stop_codon:yes gene_type:complete
VVTNGKISSENSAEKAAQKTEEIRNKNNDVTTITATTVLGGDTENWFYYFVPNNSSRFRVEARLESLGYEKAPSVKIAGCHGGDVWRIPNEIRKDHLEQRKKRVKARNI